MKIEDWYNITTHLICENDGNGLLDKYDGSATLFILSIFPEYQWDISKFKKKYSSGQIEWLKYINISTPDIQHILNNNDGEFKIPNSRYRADGYSQIKMCIYEYHGDFWHGNPAIYKQTDINPCVKITYGNLYQNTLKKERFCKDSGYNYYFIWESEWIRGKLALIRLQRKVIQKLKATKMDKTCT